jgi:hypothetical protein
MNVTPQAQHEWLHKLIGEWTTEIDAECEPGQPAHKSRGTERVRSLGGLWVLAEGQGEMPGGGQATMLMTLGYDPARERFVGTWIGSMMTHMWIYEGTLDADQRVLTLETQGPDFAGGGKLARYRDVIELVSDDERRLTSHMQGEDGQWHPFMCASYRRRKV